MEINFKFKIGDLVIPEMDIDAFESQPKSKEVTDGLLMPMKVVGLLAETCYEGTQLFYLCRTHHFVHSGARETVRISEPELIPFMEGVRRYHALRKVTP